MHWIPCYTGIRRGDSHLSPLVFTVSGYSKLLLQCESVDADPTWWLAGYCNVRAVNAQLPTFSALIQWQKIPLGEAVVELPNESLYEVSVTPADWLSDIRVRVWGDTEFAASDCAIDGGVY